MQLLCEHASMAYLDETLKHRSLSRVVKKRREPGAAHKIALASCKTLASFDPGLLPWNCSEAVTQARAIAGPGRSTAGDRRRAMSTSPSSVTKTPRYAVAENISKHDS